MNDDAPFFARLRAANARGGPVALAGRQLARAYAQLVRPLVPTHRYARFNGVQIDRRVNVFDSALARLWGRTDFGDRPAYESALMKALRAHVRPGDRVVIVGGGYGVTTVEAARRAGAGGRVTTFEGAREQLGHIERALAWASADGGTPRAELAPVELVHACVGRVREDLLRGSAEGTRLVAAADLPDCDVLELDCEGAELGILGELAQRPRVLLVETHGAYGAPAREVRPLLERLGYRVVADEWAETEQLAACHELDVRVLVALRDGATVAPA